MLIKIPTREVAKILRTGQVTSYADFDDAYFANLGLGIAREYLVFTTGQFAGTTNITLNGKTEVKSNNCVLDLKTGRMWSRYVSASVGPGSDGKLPWTTTGSGATVEGIFPYRLAANVAPGLALFTDWRIPNIREIRSIFTEHQIINIPPDSAAFPSFPAPSVNGVLWSSTTRPDATTNAFRTNRSLGGDLDDDAKTSAYIILLVRGC